MTTRERQLIEIAKALAWEWLIDGSDETKRSWMGKAESIIDLMPSYEAVARRLCRLNGNCWGYRKSELTDLCPTDADCTHWHDWDDYASAAVTAGRPRQ